MWNLIVVIAAFFAPPTTIIPKINTRFDSCETDRDCFYPMKCCGFALKYCCHVNGKPQKVKRRIFPNVTIPPLPIPLPLPIPIPV